MVNRRRWWGMVNWSWRRRRLIFVRFLWWWWGMVNRSWWRGRLVFVWFLWWW
ncbi:hypothetical protein CUMW_276130, partial [Citrus unshiu]